MIEVPTQDFLNSIFSYNKEGFIVWKKRCRDEFSCDRGWKMWNSRYEGKVAGYNAAGGYKKVGINFINYSVHRIIWVMFNGGSISSLEIDHINGIRDDNRIENLRAVSKFENQKNRRPNKVSKSGEMGVYWRPDRGLWEAQIRVNTKGIFLGRFENKDEAIKARKDAEFKYGFHENHGLVAQS